MASQKKRNSGSVSRKKRCANGSRKDKTTEICVKYVGFSVFDELKDVEIAEKGKTISLENLSGAGAIIKVYEDGNMVGQNLVEEKDIKKAKENTEKDMNRIFKMMKKIEKNPDLIATDKKFQRFLKRQTKNLAEKNGGGTESEKKKESVKVLVQKNVLDQMIDPEIKELQKRIDEIQTKIHTITSSMHQNWWSQFAIFNLFEMVTIPLANVYGSSNITGTTLTTVQNTLWFDFVGAAFLMILDITQSLYPNSTSATINIIAQYVYWTWIIASTAQFLVPITWTWSAMMIIPAAGVLNSISEAPQTTKLAELERELREAKHKLARKLEKNAQ
jgi:hypothetical protein